MIYAVAFFLYLVAGKQIHLEEWWGEGALYAKRIRAKWGVYYSNRADNPLAKDPWPLTKQIKICQCHCEQVDKSKPLMFSDTHTYMHKKYTHSGWLASCACKHTVSGRLPAEVHGHWTQLCHHTVCKCMCAYGWMLKEALTQTSLYECRPFTLSICFVCVWIFGS